MAALCVGGEARPDSVAIMLDEKYQPAMRGMQRRLYCLVAAVLSLMSLTVILIALVSLSQHPCPNPWPRPRWRYVPAGPSRLHCRR